MNGGRADRAVRWSTTAVVAGIALVAAIVSYRHALGVIRSHGESGATAYLLPLTVDGLIYAASMAMLTAARRRLPVPTLARVLLALGIVATLAANVAHGLGHGPVGAVVAGWPAVALVGSYELLMWVVRTGRTASVPGAESTPESAPEAYPVPHPMYAALPDAAEKDGRLIMDASQFADEIEAGQVPSIRRIRTYLGSGQERAKRAQEFITAHAVSAGATP